MPQTIAYTITADDDTHSMLIRLFRTLHILGNWGCSRIVEIPFDGDGPGRLDIPGLSDIPVDRAVVEKETNNDNVRANVCVPGRGIISAFLKV